MFILVEWLRFQPWQGLAGHIVLCSWATHFNFTLYCSSVLMGSRKSNAGGDPAMDYNSL